MLKFIAAALVLVATPAFAEDIIEHKSLTVEAGNDDYTPTGINVKKGDAVLIGASGIISTGAFAGKTDPNGHFGRCGSDDTDGALVYKIGPTAAQKAGKHKLVAAQTEGELKLKVRDTKYSDNRGSYAVDVIRIPRHMKPPEPIKLVVDVANDEWTLSDLKVEKGDLVIVAAAIDPANKVQFVNADPRATGTPEGLRCEGHIKIESENDGALMMKVGTSEYRRAGTLNFMVADTAGAVKFRARLQRPAGNKGTYKVGAYKFAASTIPTTANIASNE
jgi:hypothetical protein